MDLFQKFNKMSIFDDKDDFLGDFENGGNFYCESYSTKISYGPDGKKI